MLVVMQIAFRLKESWYIMTVCDWSISYSQCSEVDEQFRKSIAPETLELAEQMAVGLLNSWTDNIYGLCEVTARPYKCDDSIGSPSNLDSNLGEFGFTSALSSRGSAPWQPVLIGGEWYNLTCGRCPGNLCGCGEFTDYLSMPNPTHQIIEIYENGEKLPESAYRLEESRFLVRTDGKQWMTEQDMSKPISEPNTWQIRFSYGVPVPAGGRIAVGVLAMEIARALCDDPECALPQRIQTITRQGVTVAVQDNFEDLKDGKTGLWLVDSWLSSVRNVLPRTSIFNPDEVISRVHRRGGIW